MNIKEQCILYDAPIFKGKIVGWKMSRPNWHKRKSAEYGKKKFKIEEKIADEKQEDKKKRIKYEDLVFRIFLKGFDYCNSFYFGSSYKKILSKYNNPHLIFVLSKVELIPFEYMNRICNKRTLSEFERDVKDARDFFFTSLHHVPWNLAMNQVYDYIKKKDKMKDLFRKDKKRKLAPLEENVLIDYKSLFSCMEGLKKIKNADEHSFTPSFTMKKVTFRNTEVKVSEDDKATSTGSKFPVLNFLESQTKKNEKELRKKRKEFVINTWTSIYKKETLFRYLGLFYKDISLEFLNAIPFHGSFYNFNHRYIDAFVNAKTIYGDLRQATYINMDIISLFLDVEKKTISALRADKVVIYDGTIDAEDGEELVSKAYNAVNQGLSYSYFMTHFEKQDFDRDVKRGKIRFDRSYDKKKEQEAFFVRWDDVLKRFSNAISKGKKIYEFDEKIQRIVDFKEFFPSSRADFWGQDPSKNDP